MANNTQFGIDRYKRFLKKVHETLEIYYFYRTEEQSIFGTESHHFQAEDGSPVGVVPFWSNQAYPKNWLFDYEEYGMVLTKMPLDEFLRMLENMSAHGIILGIEWNAEGVGIELPASEVLSDLNALGQGDDR